MKNGWNLRKKQNVSAVIAVACFAIIIVYIVLNTRVAEPGAPSLCDGGICIDLVTKMPPEIALCMVLAGTGAFFARISYKYHADLGLAERVREWNATHANPRGPS